MNPHKTTSGQAVENKQPPQRTATCFVIMPSGNGNEYRGQRLEAEYVFNRIIKQTVDEVAREIDCAVEVQLSVRNNTPAIITEEVIRILETTDVVIADLTGQNPNVYYELGIRYSLDRLGRYATIPIIQDGKKLAFDVSTVRAVSYSTDPWAEDAGVQRLKDAVRDAFVTVLNNKRTLDWNPVQRVLYGIKGPDLLPSPELMGRAAIVEKTWIFQKSRISIVASSVEEKQSSPLWRHFQHSTGSGQFYAMEHLLPPLSLAHPFSKVNLYLAGQAEDSDLLTSDLILLGGATNEKTKEMHEELKERLPYVYLPAPTESQEYSTVNHRHTGEKWEVFSEHGRIERDFGIIVWTHPPDDSKRRVLIAFGGTTYGTEAAARFVVDPHGFGDDIRKTRAGESIAFALRTRVEGHRCGTLEGQPTLIGRF